MLGTTSSTYAFACGLFSNLIGTPCLEVKMGNLFPLECLTRSTGVMLCILNTTAGFLDSRSHFYYVLLDRPVLNISEKDCLDP